MRIKLRCVISALLAGAFAASIAAAPLAAADNSESCTTLNTGSTKCQKQGNVEVNDSLTRAATLPMWSSIGQQSGGPYGGAFGGGSR